MRFKNSDMLNFLSRQLIKLLDAVVGKKALILDPGITLLIGALIWLDLSGPLSLLAEFSLLKEHGVEKIFHLTNNRLDHLDSRNVIYICRPKIENMKFIAGQIKNQTRSSGPAVEYTLFFVPKRTVVCEMILEELGVFGDLTIREFHLDLIPLETDVLSLENHNAFKEVTLDGDFTSIHSMANAIIKLQAIHGIIPKICGKGSATQVLAEFADQTWSRSLQKCWYECARNCLPSSTGKNLESFLPTLSIRLLLCWIAL